MVSEISRQVDNSADRRKDRFKTVAFVHLTPTRSNTRNAKVLANPEPSTESLAWHRAIRSKKPRRHPLITDEALLELSSPHSTLPSCWMESAKHTNEEPISHALE